ncbi:MAG: hypothetical protein IKL55_01765 [Clostridia bacterium]|nr:hypothetical protein [Clostridia bacterium]
MKKKLLIVLISMICIFTIFIVEECIRLKVNDNSIPLIVFHIDENYSNDSKQLDSTYYSLGFKTEINYYLDDNSSSDNYMYNVVGKEFHLFNIIMLWAWIV